MPDYDEPITWPEHDDEMGGGARIVTTAALRLHAMGAEHTPAVKGTIKEGDASTHTELSQTEVKRIFLREGGAQTEEHVGSEQLTLDILFSHGLPLVFPYLKSCGSVIVATAWGS